MALNYDNLAKEYARNRRVHPGVVQALCLGGELSAGSRVLEVGCGTGNYARSLHALTGCATVGIDPSAEMLAFARSSVSGVRFEEGRAEALPFAADRFELIFSVDVIHHVQDRDAYFREARRVLAPGGRLCTVTDSADDIARRVPLSAYFPETVSIELARYPAIDTLESELKAAGFHGVGPETVEFEYDLHNATAFRERAFSSLHLIDEAAFTAGLSRLEHDLAEGPVRSLSLYTLLWSTSAAPG